MLNISATLLAVQSNCFYMSFELTEALNSLNPLNSSIRLCFLHSFERVIVIAEHSAGLDQVLQNRLETVFLLVIKFAIQGPARDTALAEELLIHFLRFRDEGGFCLVGGERARESGRGC